MHQSAVRILGLVGASLERGKREADASNLGHPFLLSWLQSVEVGMHALNVPALERDVLALLIPAIDL